MISFPGETGVISQPVIPDTPVGIVFIDWLESFNLGELEQMQSFDEKHCQGEAPPMAPMLDFREQTGGFALLRIIRSEPFSLIVIIQEKHSDTVAQLEMSVSSEDPQQMLNLNLFMTARPADLAIERMTESAALKALSAHAESESKHDRFSGALLIAKQGKILLQECWGLADRESGKAISLDTQFRLGSINKMFTAVAILQLIEKRQLTLDDPIGNHLTDYPHKETASKVTVRHLLTHTGGTGDIFGPAFNKNRLALKEHSDYLKLYGERALTHEPGSEHQYSNFGYVLLGALIENLSSVSYNQFMRDNIFLPVGMTSTDSEPETSNVLNRCKSYTRDDGKWLPNADFLPWSGNAAGGGYSTVGDLFRFSKALESDSLISRAMLIEATRLQTEDYGFGFELSGEGLLQNYGHGGGAPGMNGMIRIYPKLGYLLIGLSNFDPRAATRLIDYYEHRMPLTSPL